MANPAASSAAPPPPRAPAAAEVTLSEDQELVRLGRLKRISIIQAWAIAALTLIFLAILPFAQPYYLYYAMNPDKQVLQMVGLTMPNMTNRAVLSWSTTSITEIMTMGFGDLDIKVPKQRNRFTSAGWDAYKEAFIRQKIGDTFRKSQLVLTTVPSNTPVIAQQGINGDNVYQWIVQMPVIMTYATNNNVTDKKRAIITLTIVRVPAEESPSGIAIQAWAMG